MGTGAYDDRDGTDLDGWSSWWTGADGECAYPQPRDALRLRSSFEGERCLYGGKIFEVAANIPSGLLFSGNELDMPIPVQRSMRSRQAKYEVLKANDLSRTGMCGLLPGAARARIWVSPRQRNPVRMAVAVLGVGCNYYGDSEDEGRQARYLEMEAPEPRDDPLSHAKASGLYMICTMSKHAAEAKGCSDAMMFDYRGYVAEATGANIFFVKDGEVHTPIRLLSQRHHRQTVIGMLKDRQVKVMSVTSCLTSWKVSSNAG